MSNMLPFEKVSKASKKFALEIADICYEHGKEFGMMLRVVSRQMIQMAEAWEKMEGNKDA